MIIDCISDLHGFYPELEGGDLLIVAGDLTARDTYVEYQKFFEWLKNQNYRKKIFICGNHDNKLHDFYCTPEELIHFEYLCDSGTEFEGLKIWGSPWTKTFPGMNPKCKAFTVDTEEELVSKFSLIPDDIDILITHGPPLKIGDEVLGHRPYPENVGSLSLCNKIKDSKIKLHVFGHIHEGYCKEILQRQNDGHELIFVNCSHVNERYQPVNKPIRIIL